MEHPAFGASQQRRAHRALERAVERFLVLASGVFLHLQPASSVEAMQEMEDLCSPVSAFVREKCRVEAGLRIYIDVLYREWQEWCEREGRSSVTTKQTFGRDLTAAFLTVARRRGTNQNFYEGIALA